MSTEPRPNVGAGIVVLWLGGGFLAVALILGMLTIAGADNQGVVLDWLTSVLLLITSGASVTAVVQSKKTSTHVRAQGLTIAKIDENTNGKLDTRIRAAIKHALDQVTKTADSQEGGTS